MYKTFNSSNLRMFVLARVFVIGKAFQLSIMFVGKAKSLPWVQPLKGTSLGYATIELFNMQKPPKFVTIFLLLVTDFLSWDNKKTKIWHIWYPNLTIIKICWIGFSVKLQFENVLWFKNKNQLIEMFNYLIRCKMLH